MKHPRLVLALSLAGLFVAPLTADAAVVVSDDAMFSVDLAAPGTAVCFVEPRSLRTEEDCAGLELTDFPVAPVTEPSARLAQGVVRGAGQGAARPVLGVVSMIRATSHATAAPNQATAESIGEEVAGSVAASLPAGARLLPSSSKIAWGKNVPVVRSTLVTSGLEAGGPGADHAVDAHREVLTAIGGRYLYVTVWTGPREHAAQLAGLADAAALTTDLKPEARPVTKLNPWPGRLLFFFGALGLILLRLRKKRAPVPKPPAS